MSTSADEGGSAPILVGDNGATEEADQELPAPTSEPGWTGRAGEAWTVGRAGRSAGVVARLAPDQVGWPDTVTDGAEAGDLTVRAASVRGLSHRYYRTPRQDDYAITVDAAERYLIAVVADGVSAGRESHRAANVVTHRGAQLLATSLATTEPADIEWGELLENVAQEVVEVGRAFLPAADAATSSWRIVAELMASTALFAVVPLATQEGGGRRVVTLAVGDTSAWIIRGGSSWEPLGDVKNAGSEVASSAVIALPHLPAQVTPLDADLAPGDVLVLMSDGVGDPLGNGDGVVGRFLASVWSSPPKALDFASQVGFARKSFDDDRTVVAVWAPAARTP